MSCDTVLAGRFQGNQFHHEDEERDSNRCLRRIIRARGRFRGREDGLRSHHLSHALILWRVSPFAVVAVFPKTDS